MNNRNRINDIAFEATKVADNSPVKADFRVKPQHIEPIIRAEMPEASNGLVAGVLRDLFRELENYSSKRPMANNGQYIFVEVERPYDFPEQSKTARDRVAMVVGYAVAVRAHELPDDLYETTKCACSSDGASSDNGDPSSPSSGPRTGGQRGKSPTFLVLLGLPIQSPFPLSSI